MSNYVRITATKQIKPMAGKLIGVFCSIAGGGSLTFYDSANSSTSDPVAISTIALTDGTYYSFSSGGIFLKNGIYCVAAGLPFATVIYE